jgi:DNA-binding response OmpR family regulator
MARILIVDDETAIRLLYEEYLTREGHQVETVAGGQEALRRVEEKNYDLMVLDIELVNNNGLDVLKETKKHQPDLPVILNSAYSVYKADFSSWIADAYVMKSSDLKPLLNKINQLVEVKA